MQGPLLIPAGNAPCNQVRSLSICKQAMLLGAGCTGLNTQEKPFTQVLAAQMHT